jgi:hypothetical protein
MAKYKDTTRSRTLSEVKEEMSRAANKIRNANTRRKDFAAVGHLIRCAALGLAKKPLDEWQMRAIDLATDALNFATGRHPETAIISVPVSKDGLATICRALQARDAFQAVESESPLADVFTRRKQGWAIRASLRGVSLEVPEGSDAGEWLDSYFAAHRAARP